MEGIIEKYEIIACGNGIIIFSTRNSKNSFLEDLARENGIFSAIDTSLGENNLYTPRKGCYAWTIKIVRK